MPTLLERIEGTTDGVEKIEVHRFFAAMVEFKAGSITASQAKSGFNLTASQATAAQEIIDKIDAGTITGERVHSIFLLLETHDYSVSKAEAELGITDG